MALCRHCVVLLSIAVVGSVLLNYIHRVVFFTHSFIMSLSKLDQLRATMESLDSYELPDKFSEPPVDQVLDEETIERYKKARDEYIHRRMLQVFYDHVGTLDENGEFSLPQLPSLEEQEELSQKRTQVQRELLATAASLNQDNEALQAKYSAFCARRQELAKMIADIEENPSSQDLLMDDDDEEEDIDQEAFTYEGQHLADATQRKAELELELERIRHEKTVARKALEETKHQVDELQKKRGAIVRSVSPETLQEMESDTASMRQKVKELKEMSEWYGGLCQVMEEIGGIKLLAVDNGDDDSNEVVAKVQLFGKHEIHVSMSSRGNAFHVTNAKFVTSTLVRSVQDPESNSSVQMNIPALDDLVRLCSNLGSVEDLRFLLRETMARIQTITARVDELALLRTRFLTKIGKLQTTNDYSFGGQEQEVVCSLNEGITAVLRLSPDCPMLDGSILLDQIVGVGGWDVAILDRIKDRVNASPNCKGPLALMETLVKEIRRIQTEEGISLPGTPSMPARK